MICNCWRNYFITYAIHQSDEKHGKSLAIICGRWEEIATLALFDNNFTEETKTRMCEASHIEESKIIEEKRLIAKEADLAWFLDKGLSKFVVEVFMWSNNKNYR